MESLSEGAGHGRQKPIRYRDMWIELTDRGRARLRVTFDLTEAQPVRAGGPFVATLWLGEVPVYLRFDLVAMVRGLAMYEATRQGLEGAEDRPEVRAWSLVPALLRAKTLFAD